VGEQRVAGEEEEQLPRQLRLGLAQQQQRGPGQLPLAHAQLVGQMAQQ
jgi:hypothetical protein